MGQKEYQKNGAWGDGIPQWRLANLRPEGERRFSEPAGRPDRMLTLLRASTFAPGALG